jgi:hypothetical protein
MNAGIIFIRVFHTGLLQDGRPNTNSVQINDLDVGYENQNRKVQVYVPVGGFVDIPLSSRSLLSLVDGAIAKFVQAGVLRLDFFVKIRNSGDLGGLAGTGAALSVTALNAERVNNNLRLVIDAGLNTSGFIVGERIEITGLSGAFAGLDAVYTIQSIAKATNLIGTSPVHYLIVVQSIGANIPAATLAGVNLALIDGKVTFELAGSGNAGGYGSDYITYVGGHTATTGFNDPTVSQYTPIASASAPKMGIFVKDTDLLPYFKDITGTDQPLIGGGGGGVPPTRQVIAGDGLVGGGDLSADRTFDVVANADGSIIVNADDIQVGVLATDAQHGNRGGGTQHAVATTLAAGFMSSADKTKLDGITTGASTSILLFGASSVTATTTTRYLFPSYHDGLAQTSPIQYRVPRAGTLKNMRVRHNTTGGNGNAIVYTLRVNGVASALSISLASTATDGSDLVNSVTVAAGDLIDIEVTKAATIGTSPSATIAAMEFAA